MASAKASVDEGGLVVAAVESSVGLLSAARASVWAGVAEKKSIGGGRWRCVSSLATSGLRLSMAGLCMGGSWRSWSEMVSTQFYSYFCSHFTEHMAVVWVVLLDVISPRSRHSTVNLRFEQKC
jgi:hypothetical protein